MRETDVAIIGMSCIFPGAVDLTAFWQNIIDKKDAIQTVPADRLDALYFEGSHTGADRFYCNRGGFIPDVTFDPVRFGILPLAVEGMEPDQLLTLDLACKALDDAGVLDHKAALERTGIIIGKGNYAGPGATRAIEIVRTGEQIAEVLRSVLPSLSEQEINKVKKEYQQQKGRFSADTAMGLIPNLVASLVANRLNLGGAAYTVDAACASSLMAVDQAIQEICNGRSDMMIAGGVHVAQNAAFWSIFNQLGALSRKQQIRPFDQDADGLLIGEGCGFVILKKLSEAIKDGNKIYAVIKGVGVSSDGSGASVMSPAVKGQVKAIQQAWAKSGIDLNDVGYIEAHGTGTPLGDKTELETLQLVFGKDASLPMAGIGTVKSNIGHAMPAAGIAGLIKTALALYYDQLPPTLHCTQPLAQMEQTRFRPVQELSSWSGSGLKPYAGVNAFGFGGINAHAVLEGYPQNNKTKAASIKKDKVLLLARNNKEALIQALTDGETTMGEGDYRIALFAPDGERITKAIKIVSKDKPWRNKQDIWFTNQPLLQNGGKLAFVFPGLDGLASGEIESVAACFGMALSPDNASGDGLLGQALKVLEKSSILDSVLKQLGIQPDMNAGHSLGEWLAARSSELAEEESVMQLLDILDPATFELKNSRFIAVGCGLDLLNPIMEGIPDLYLSNDNCPSQVILCGTYTALDELILVLKARQIFHQVLPFQSGFHSPFVADKLDLLLQGMENMRFRKTKIPLWSATTLETYPESFEAIRQLSVEHLIKPVRFRELTLKLYEEGARVFVQIGSGGLTGFIEDTLKGKMYSAIASNVPVRSGIAQLQRVLAALFAEGKNINLEFLGVKNEPAKPAGKGIKLQLGSPLVKGWQHLKDIAATQFTAIPLKELSMDEVAHPVMRAMKDNVDEMIRMQQDMMTLFRNTERPAVASNGKTIQPQQTTAAYIPFVQQLDISLQNAPYLIDHSLLRQPRGWHDVQDMDPVIPMTMIFEVFGETAAANAANQKVHKILNTKVLQWMNVAQPFRETIMGTWKQAGLAVLNLAKYASAEVLLTPVLPEAPVTDEAIGKDLGIQITAQKIYEEHMFHGPAYQGILSVTAVADNGIRGIIKGAAGKGSLLDNAGQLFGLWLQLTLTKDRIAFPVKIQEIAFYGDMQDQQGEFECTCVLTAMNDEFATANIIMKREGKTWAIITGWQNRRLEIDEALWKVSMSPLHNRLSEEIAPGVFMFHNAYTRMVSWDFILKRYFNQEEKKFHQTLSPGKKKEWMISRVAVKDAVRALLQRERQESWYPITFHTGSDAVHRPFVAGDMVQGIEVSLAHKGTYAVAIASGSKAVGIDIELIAERTEGFMKLSYTAQELELIKDKDQAEWSTRLWVAKEAYGKMLGQGLKGNPKAYEVQHISNEELLINDIRIKTIKHKNYIIGWTQ